MIHQGFHALSFFWLYLLKRGKWELIQFSKEIWKIELLTLKVLEEQGEQH